MTAFEKESSDREDAPPPKKMMLEENIAQIVGLSGVALEDAGRLEHELKVISFLLLSYHKG